MQNILHDAFKVLRTTANQTSDFVSWFEEHPETIPGLAVEYFSAINVDMSINEVKNRSGDIKLSYVLQFFVHTDDATLDAETRLSTMMGVSLGDAFDNKAYSREYLLELDICEWRIALVDAILHTYMFDDDTTAMLNVGKALASQFPGFKPEAYQVMYDDGMIPQESLLVRQWLDNLGNQRKVELGNELI